MKFSGLSSFLEASQNSQTQISQVLGAPRSFYEMLPFEALSRFENSLYVIVCRNQRECSKWAEIFEPLYSKTSSSWFGAFVFPSFTGWGAERYVNPIMARKQRMQVLSQALYRDRPAIIITTLQGIAQKTLSRTELEKSSFLFRKGEELDIDLLDEKLNWLGYREVPAVDEEGTYAYRGSVIDVFPSNMEDPVRLELLGDTITSIKTFSLSSQRTLHELEFFRVSPAQEAVVTPQVKDELIQKAYDYLLETEVTREDREGWLDAFRLGTAFPGFDMLTPVLRQDSGSLLDYLVEGDRLFLAEPLETLLEEYRESFEDWEEQESLDQKKGRISVGVARHFLEDEVLSSKLLTLQIHESGNPVQRPGAQILQAQTSDHYAQFARLRSLEESRFESWVKYIKEIIQDNGRVLIAVRNEEHLKRYKNLFEHRGLDLHFLKGFNGVLKRAKAASVMGAVFDVSEAYWDGDLRLLVLPESDLFGAKSSKKKRASVRLQNYLNSFRDLSKGDLVVHIQHGIGRYQGMRSMEVGGSLADFLILEYKGGDRIYMPVDKLNLLQKYSAGDGASGSIDSLKSQNWKTRKSRVRKKVRDMAEQLLKIHAKRKLNEGHSYSPTDDNYYKFESTFPYDETEDQARVISEVNEDLSTRKPMDRLVCGDVGFGKTEVALRAAFRVVLDHRQTIVLVPTTVLCYQHYRTFYERMNRFGVKVEHLNRFVSKAEQTDILKRFAEGKVDVLIGTHRVLSKDIVPHRLGLIIIDEEQRFGVGHKEKLKELKANCDILTLSATPIPRTLHISMLGLRDISIITTPPTDRQSVRTFVAQFDELLVREAIEREIARGGQVFYVHNRVEDITQIAAFVKTLVPSARVQFAHGQMTERQLENVIIDFLEHKFDVMVCTTIIESGIDMPNVNTLIVNRADRFGLSQLYQIRGRVGRSSRQAYAYFMTPPHDSISDDARKRLEILSSHQELGSGFQIASHDMELRGVGNLLGGEQSGSVADVGIELYTEMLEATIRELKGGGEYKERADVELKIPIQAVIPHEFIKNEGVRLQLYKNLFSCDGFDDLERLKEETRDKFGPFPDKLQLLFQMAELKIKLIDIHALKLITKPRGDFEISFSALGEREISHLIDLVTTEPKTYRLSPNYQLYLPKFERTRRAEMEREAEMVAYLNKLIDPLHLLFTERSEDSENNQ